MTRTLGWLVLIGCSSAPTTAHAPQSSPGRDAAVADAPGDAGVPQAVADAPAWLFRYQTPERSETWTLRYGDGAALLVVETARGVTRYLGTAKAGATLTLDVSTGSAKLTLDCKHGKRPIGSKCNDAKAKPIELLDCYHPDFKEPMPFGRAPGIEYVQSSSCTGYRMIAP